MDWKTRFGSGAGPIGATVLGAIVLVGGAIGFAAWQGRAPDVPDVAAVSAVEAVSTADQAPDPEVAEATTTPEATLEQAIDPVAPRLDVVRVEPDGMMVIAGRAPQGMAVNLLLEGAFLLAAEPDAAGHFVALTRLSPSDAPRVLTIEGRNGDGDLVAGLDSVLVAPFAAPEPAIDPVAEVAPPTPEIEEADAEPAASDVALVEDPLPEAAPEVVDLAEIPAETITPVETATVPTDEAPAQTDLVAPPADVATAPVAADDDRPTAPAAEPAAPSAPIADVVVTPVLPSSASTTSPQVTARADTRPAAAPIQPAQAPTVVIAGPDGLRISQAPGAQPQVQTQVVLDAISYDTEGEVVLAGRGPEAARVQILLNNQPIQLGEIGPGGAWSLQLPDVDPGTYTLVVAELDDDGAEASRIETPFLREDPERIAEVPAEAAAQGIEVLTVQPDMTLWGIARDTFGDGILYVQIFEQNRDQIRDPNWIFPGQIFRLPDLPRETEAN